MNFFHLGKKFGYFQLQCTTDVPSLGSFKTKKGKEFEMTNWKNQSFTEKSNDLSRDLIHSKSEV